MSLLTLIGVVVLVGIVLWAIDRFVPMNASIKQLLIVVVVIFLCIWLAQGLGLLDWLGSVRIGR